MGLCEFDSGNCKTVAPFTDVYTWSILLGVRTHINILLAYIKSSRRPVSKAREKKWKRTYYITNIFLQDVKCVYLVFISHHCKDVFNFEKRNPITLCDLFTTGTVKMS